MGNANRIVTAPAPRLDGETKLADTPTAKDFRAGRTVAKLKKLREEHRDQPELAAVWAEIDKLEG